MEQTVFHLSKVIAYDLQTPSRYYDDIDQAIDQWIENTQIKQI